MNKIQILPEILRNKIAAGEVVERPASVLKELVENAIDAGCRHVTVEIEEGGRRLIRVKDDGSGMTPEDVSLSCQRHATSKIQSSDDLESIGTLGFRGEALSSIASVARVRLISARLGSSSATELLFEGGVQKGVRQTSAPPGTMVEVEDLFYNVPARLKFMKTVGTEFSHILQTLESLALPHKDIHFRLTHNGQEKLNIPPVKSVRERVFQIMGQDQLDQLMELDIEVNGFHLNGFTSLPPFSFGSREHQEFFINKRAIRSPVLGHALSEAYQNAMMTGRFPAAVLFLDVSYDSVDVNVHPTKREVRFHQPRKIHDMVLKEIRKKLGELSRGPVSSDRDYSYPLGPRPSLIDTEVGEIRMDYGGHRSSGVLTQDEAFSTIIHPLGQIDQTYIVAEINGELHLIDQHAGHERVLFDRLMMMVEVDQPEQQPLLISETVELSPSDSNQMREVLPVLKSAGLEIESFGENAFLIRSAPAILGPFEGRELLIDLLDDMKEGVGTKAIKNNMRIIMASMACHGAIKAHQRLSSDQMKELLINLSSIAAPTCPHGRPVRVIYKQKDLEKLFQRI